MRVAVGGKLGGEGRVACHGDGARVVGVLVVPLHESGSRRRVWRSCSSHAGRCTAATAHAAHGGAVARRHDAVGVQGEVGGEGRVLTDDDGARVLCVAVVPLHEVVAVVGGGGEAHQVLVVIDAAAAHVAHVGVGVGDGDGAHVAHEDGRERVSRTAAI